ncbi:MAG: RNA methyltransferase, partial [Candidatus Aenigmarchaeota archaeon]|nr:RNA methyltransferase [Candidatus Aenigmarchaeota archaeon]
MQQIFGLQNPIVKMAFSLQQKKNRQKTGMFLIEGFKGVEDALNYGLEITHIFLNSSHKEKILYYPKNLIYLVDDKILKKISTTDTPPEILAIAKQFKYSIKDLFKDKNPLIIVLENIKDPGNLGTVIRTSKAANASGIILTGDTTDLFNPKTVRSAAANLWKIPVI